MANPLFFNKRMGRRTLVVTEKPSVAKSIADALGISRKKNGCYENAEYTVAWCIGHLVGPAPPERYGEKWKKWSLESLPVLPGQWKYEVKKEAEGHYSILAGLFSSADEIINACDAGREGELIFRLVYEMAGCTKPVRRLWLSSMEEKAIREGIAQAEPGSRYDSLYQAALCRQRADWLVGINGTRLFTALYGGRVLKVGRVLTPVLAMVAEREQEAAGFQRVPYYCVHICCDGVDAVSGRMEKEDAANLAETCRGSRAVVESVKKEEKQAAPPKLYDLTALQVDAGRVFGFTAKQTLECLQGLYEKKIVTYPRTDSRFLTDDMGGAAQTAVDMARAVFPGSGSSVCPDAVMEAGVSKLLDSRKVTDHHALILTGEAGRADLSRLTREERDILSLLACRVLCAAGEKHLFCTSRAELSCMGHLFTVSVKMVIENGWKGIEDAFRECCKGDGGTDSENVKAALPELGQGQELEVMRVEVKEYFTQPPERFTDGTLLAAMERAGSGSMADGVERRGLGTPATRADIIEKLVSDGFIKREKKHLVPTAEGIGLAAVLPEDVKSPGLTAEWENSLALVAARQMDADAFMEGIRELVSGLVSSHAQDAVSVERKNLFARKREVLGICPKCGGRIVTGRYGAYCEDRCKMAVAKYYSTFFTDSQVKSLLQGEKILLDGLKGRDGKPYGLYLEPAGVEEYSYEKNGKMEAGYRFAFKKSYPERK